jgi:hypothetical protein
VVAFCGKGNAGMVIADMTVLHAWVSIGDDILDCSVGDWFESAKYAEQHEQLQRQLIPGAVGLGAIQWTIPRQPPFWWKPRAELVGPWRPTGSPELGSDEQTWPIIQTDNQEYPPGYQQTILSEILRIAGAGALPPGMRDACLTCPRCRERAKRHSLCSGT